MVGCRGALAGIHCGEVAHCLALHHCEGEACGELDVELLHQSLVAHAGHATQIEPQVDERTLTIGAKSQLLDLGHLLGELQLETALECVGVVVHAEFCTQQRETLGDGHVALDACGEAELGGGAKGGGVRVEVTHKGGAYGLDIGCDAHNGVDGANLHRVAHLVAKDETIGAILGRLECVAKERANGYFVGAANGNGDTLGVADSHFERDVVEVVVGVAGHSQWECQQSDCAKELFHNAESFYVFCSFCSL